MTRRQYPEHNEQAALFTWAALHVRQYPDLECLFAIPNEGRRTRREGRRMVDRGLRSGVPDVFLPAGRCGLLGLFVEMKAPGKGRRRPPPEQAWWRERLVMQGYGHLLADRWGDAADCIQAYLDGTLDVRIKHNFGIVRKNDKVST